MFNKQQLQKKAMKRIKGKRNNQRDNRRKCPAAEEKLES